MQTTVCVASLTLRPQRSLRTFTLLVLAVVGFPAGCGSPYDGTVRKHDRITLSGQHDRVHSLCFSPDGTQLASASADGSVRIWDTHTWREVLTIQEPGTPAPTVYCVVYSPDGKTIATGEDNGTVKLYDAAGKELTTFRTREGCVRSVAFSPDARTLAAGEADGTMSLWDVGTGALRLRFTGHDATVWCVAFSPDGTMLASGGWDGTARVWDPTTGKELRRLDGVDGLVRALVFFPDGMTVATAGNFVRLHDPATGRQKMLLRGHVSNATSVAVGAGGKVLVSGGQAGEVKVWDAATGKVRGTLWGSPREEVWAVALAPDGKTIASGTAKGTVKIWDLVD